MILIAYVFFLVASVLSRIFHRRLAFCNFAFKVSEKKQRNFSTQFDAMCFNPFCKAFLTIHIVAAYHSDREWTWHEALAAMQFSFVLPSADTAWFSSMLWVVCGGGAVWVCVPARAALTRSMHLSKGPNMLVFVAPTDGGGCMRSCVKDRISIVDWSLCHFYAHDVKWDTQNLPGF